MGNVRDSGSIPVRKIPCRRHGHPLQCSCLENPMDRGAWWATVHRVAKNWTWLKRLSIAQHRPIQSVYVFCLLNTVNLTNINLLINYPPLSKEFFSRLTGSTPLISLLKALTDHNTILFCDPMDCRTYGQRNLVDYGPQGHKETQLK